MFPFSPEKRKINCIDSSTPVPKAKKPFYQEQEPSAKRRKVPNECPVSVEIQWSAEKRVKILPDILAPLGKMLCRGTFKQISRAAWHCEPIRKHLFEEVAKQIHKESVSMCLKKSDKEGKKRTDSCLRKTDKNSMLEFSFDTLVKELAEKAPLLLLVMRTASLNVKDTENKWIPPVGIAAAVCLKHRSKNMTAVQLLMAILIRHSGFMVSLNIRTRVG